MCAGDGPGLRRWLSPLGAVRGHFRWRLLGRSAHGSRTGEGAHTPGRDVRGYFSRPRRTLPRYRLFRRVGRGALWRHRTPLAGTTGARATRAGDIAMLRGSEVRQVLAGRELEVIQAVRRAYEAHGDGDSSLPHSTFLAFPGQPRDRIVALPAYLGGACRIAGVKWVSSFPDNLNRGIDRASAIVILNSPQTGRPEAVLEGSAINAKRTAASAALAATCMLTGHGHGRDGAIGCGLINFEIARFLRAVFRDVETFILFDLDEARAR